MANKKINQLVSKTSILSTDLFGIGDATTGQLFKKTIAELQAAIGGAVISVNGLVGTVVLDTDDIQELATPTNKYFTDARARNAISLTVTGNSGASTYSSGTGVLNVPTYTLAGLGGITASFLSGTSGISYNSTTGVISYSGTVYTDSSIRALLSGSTGITYNSSTGAISYSGTVYTDSSVRALISLTTTGTSGASTYNNTTGVINVPDYTLAGLGGISLTSLSGGTGITYNSSTGAISYSGTVYTDASVRALISATGNISYNSTTGVISTSLTQYTDALARASVSLTTTGTSGASTYNSTTGVLNIPQYQSALTNPVTGTGTSGHVAYWNGSGSIAGSANLFWDNINGRLGIGTSSPGTKLEIASSSFQDHLIINRTGIGLMHITATNPRGLAITDGTTQFLTIAQSTGNVGIGTTSPNTLLTTNQTGTTGYFYSGQKSGTEIAYWYYSASEVQFSSKEAARALVFLTSDIERLRIAANGRVGIGTNNPAQALDVVGGDAGTSHRLRVMHATSSAFVQIYTDPTSAGFIAGNFVFFFEVNGAERGRITTDGNWLLGTTSNNGERLYVSGNIRATGTITANSDLTLKKNLLRIENALEKVEQINGYTYELKEDDSKRHAGVIAQEIQTVLPEIVNKGNDGILGVEYGNISALLIEAIKEQQTQINELKALLNK